MDLKDKNILIVDDKQANLKLLYSILSKEDFKVRVANNGYTALESIQTAYPDLILLDICMPDINGYEVCERIRLEHPNLDAPIIFLSALNEELDKEKAFTIGGVDFITKPFQIKEVLARIRNHLTLSDLQKKLKETNKYLDEKVKEKTHELRKSNEQLKKEIKQRKDYEIELIKAKEQAEEANLAKTKFLRSFHHELRTPLNGLNGMLSLMRWTQLTTEQQQYVTNMEHSYVQLFEMIDEILTIERLNKEDTERVVQKFQELAV